MAKFDINSYARRGAELRITELNQELESIYAAFPDLRGESRGRRGRRARATADSASSAASPVARRRRGMTAAQRKAVSARMKRYWAERRKGKQS